MQERGVERPSGGRGSWSCQVSAPQRRECDQSDRLSWSLGTAGAAGSSSSPATRTPIRRTGRGGFEPAQQLARDRARRVSSSFTAASSERARVTVEKSSKRTLMPIVRPRRLLLARASRRAARSAARSTGSSSARARAGRGRRSSRATRTWPRARSRCRARPRSGPGAPGAGRAAARTSPSAARRAAPPSAARVAMPCARAAPRSSGRCRERARARRRRSARAPRSARQLHEAVGLLGVGGHLGHQLAGPDPDRAAQPGARVHRRLDPPRRGPGRSRPVRSM